MKYAADFRRIAREALSGKWMIAVLVGLVATLLGGAGSGGPELKPLVPTLIFSLPDRLFSPPAAD